MVFAFGKLTTAATGRYSEKSEDHTTKNNTAGFIQMASPFLFRPNLLIRPKAIGRSIESIVVRETKSMDHLMTHYDGSTNANHFYFAHKWISPRKQMVAVLICWILLTRLFSFGTSPLSWYHSVSICDPLRMGPSFLVVLAFSSHQVIAIYTRLVGLVYFIFAWWKIKYDLLFPPRYQLYKTPPLIAFFLTFHFSPVGTVLQNMVYSAWSIGLYHH